MALTQEAVLSFLLDRGGRARNSELLSSFRSLISCGEPEQKLHNRDLFKKLVNSVAVVKQIDGVKFVVVKKRYQDFVREAAVAGDASPTSPDWSFSYGSPTEAPSVISYSDVENNNNNNVNCADATTVKILNISGDQRRKSGAVFAVIAVKSPQRVSAPAAQPQVLFLQETPHKVSAPVPEPAESRSLPAPSESECCRNRPQSKTTKPGEDAKCPESVPLDPVAHEWLVKCAAGLWGQIYGLLLQDARLAHRKDFMSGFTALHWAAKDGNVEMVHKLMDVSRSRGNCVNVNSKAHGGYTPLHIAAIHRRHEVMVLLVQTYGANVNERDNDGKKAVHYLGRGVPAEVRGLLGGLQQSKEKSEDGEYREQPKGLNSISKLFQPHMGKRQKTKFAHDW